MSDMWSLGVCLYRCLVGVFPFKAASMPDLFRAIARGSFTVPADIDANASDLIVGLLQADVGKRLSASQAIRHVYFN